MSVSLSIASIGVLVFLAHLFAGVFERTHIPDVLFLILLGLCLQPASAWIMPADSGALGAIFGAITLVAILFEGGLDLPLTVLKKTIRQTLTLTILNFVATMVLVAAVTHYVAGFGLMVSFLFGAIVACTAAAVIIPLVRQIGMEAEGQSILSVESSVNNVLSFVITFALLDACRSGQLRLPLMGGQIVLSLLVSSLIGCAGGLLWLGLFDWIRKLRNNLFTTFAFAFAIFGLVEAFRASGYVAALIFGITLGNGRIVGGSGLGSRLRIRPVEMNQAERHFFSEITFLFKGFFFVYVGLAIRFSDVRSLYVGLLLTVIIFALRILVSRLSVKRVTRASDAALIAVMGPKGIAVAALGSIVAQYGVPGGEKIRNLCFAIVFFSISATSVSVFLLKRTSFRKCH